MLSEFNHLYFEEAGTHRREEALTSLEQYFDGTEMFDSLEEALECSKDLMDNQNHPAAASPPFHRQYTALWSSAGF